jgi:hypothetical protein
MADGATVIDPPVNLNSKEALVTIVLKLVNVLPDAEPVIVKCTLFPLTLFIFTFP